MIKKAIRMKLHPGYEAEYEKRHRELWPELKEQLIAHGAKSYQIFLDPETLALFGYLEIEDETRWQQLAATEINQKWWQYMAELMETNSDDSPVTQELKQVFTL
ncbi:MULTISPECIES: L-rhamnose mutarotase [unclassified Enterococcus]|uniref:L-rhamnose mutarotase n=1 Tax=unclassified Enterococcus TaxID=2608891 RepID=UPI000A332811|nr:MULTISPECIES: L-rhamnose mutarotase [unclassified Enterococcus]MBO0426993.1 L-rhamnose mutarotase [Enterococcus faecium]OTO33403.1 L-rhamnose 1-epimerase [Enterococcus sp. 2G9_DIV0600]OTO36114.1 L-rhamnose 1-epimerase [Enterococcus sp. 2F9_DIV0599]